MSLLGVWLVAGLQVVACVCALQGWDIGYAVCASSSYIVLSIDLWRCQR